ncbi:sensor domain-containing diguanylate cyclase [Hahella ganghwensis]|uniref:sensor domain-containing diguanylate cyclase n=1 Tax=Hahella ganghwensis TaxID=286420 RepID=UPI00037F6E2B|nr:diguanylate cyclase [Hahella ganghwensis]
MKTLSLWFKFGASLAFSILVMAVLLAVVVLTKLLPAVEELEGQRARIEVDRITGAIFHELEVLEQVNLDWSAWDDSYEFILNQKASFIKSNLNDESLANLGLHAVIYYRENGDVVWGKTWDFDAGLDMHIEELPLNSPPIPGFMLSLALNSGTDKEAGYTGLLQTRYGLMLISLKPVLRSDLSGPPVGGLLLGRLITGSVLGKIQKAAGIPFNLYMLGDNEPRMMHQSVVAKITNETPIYVKKINDKKLLSYTLLPDLYSDLSILVEVNISRDFFRLVSKAFTDFSFYMSAAIFLVMLAFAFLIYILVISPLADLKNYVLWVKNLPEDEALQAPRLNQDEIGTIGDMFYRLVGQLRDQSAQLRDLSLTDPLTGLANRRAFDQYMVEQWKYCVSKGCPLSIIVCDVDFFKKYNDNYGHAMGDSVLKEVASALSKSANKRYDLTARYGGEEFIIVLPNTSYEQGVAVAERLCESVREMQIPHQYASHSKWITISCGVTGGVPDTEDCPDDWIAWADQAMYMAKNRGRDQAAKVRPTNCLASADV